MKKLLTIAVIAMLAGCNSKKEKQIRSFPYLVEKKIGESPPNVLPVSPVVLFIFDKPTLSSLVGLILTLRDGRTDGERIKVLYNKIILIILIKSKGHDIAPVFS